MFQVEFAPECALPAASSDKCRYGGSRLQLNHWIGLEKGVVTARREESEESDCPKDRPRDRLRLVHKWPAQKARESEMLGGSVGHRIQRRLPKDSATPPWTRSPAHELWPCSCNGFGMRFSRMPTGKPRLSARQGRDQPQCDSKNLHASFGPRTYQIAKLPAESQAYFEQMPSGIRTSPDSSAQSSAIR